MPRVQTRNRPPRQAQEAAWPGEGYYANKSKLYRAAKESVDTALKYAFVGRRRRSATSAGCGVVRINAAARENGLTYGAVDFNGSEAAPASTLESQEPVGARHLESRRVCEARSRSKPRARPKSAPKPSARA
jgi:ribosomal protein L20